MKCPDCTWLCACDYHSREFDRIDYELSSFHIVKMMEMANKRVENAVECIEDKTQGFVLTPFGKLVCGVVLAFFLWLATM